MDIFDGTHIWRVQASHTMDDGFRIGVAQADSNGQPIGNFSHDNNALFASESRIKVYAMIIRHMLAQIEPRPYRTTDRF